MSIECLNQALKIEFEGQTPTKRLILILLANYCDEFLVHGVDVEELVAVRRAEAPHGEGGDGRRQSDDAEHLGTSGSK